MKYNVSINEKSKTITVELDGYKGVAKCCDTDQFNLSTGIELALERAKVAKKEAEAKKAEKTTPNLEGYGNIMALVKALEKALPKGQMVIVGNGDGLTEKQKAWLHSLTDCGCDSDCDSDRYSETEMENACDEAHDEGYNEGYEDGYAAGLADAQNELDEEKLDEAMENIRSVIEEALGM